MARPNWRQKRQHIISRKLSGKTREKAGGKEIQESEGKNRGSSGQNLTSAGWKEEVIELADQKVKQRKEMSTKQSKQTSAVCTPQI